MQICGHRPTVRDGLARVCVSRRGCRQGDGEGDAGGAAIRGDGTHGGAMACGAKLRQSPSARISGRLLGQSCPQPMGGHILTSSGAVQPNATLAGLMAAHTQEADIDLRSRFELEAA